MMQFGQYLLTEMAGIEEFVAQFDLVKSRYDLIIKSLQKDIDTREMDNIINKAFHREFKATNLDIKAPSKAVMAKGGKAVILHRQYEDDEMEMTVKIEADVIYHLFKVIKGSAGKGNIYVYARCSAKAKEIKSKHSWDCYEAFDCVSEEDVRNIRFFDVMKQKCLDERRLQSYSDEINLQIARVNAKAQKSQEKAEMMDPKKVRAKFLNTANTVEKKVFENIEKNYKEELIRRNVEYVKKIKAYYNEAKAFEYPMKMGTGRNEKWIHDAKEAVVFKYQGDAFLATVDPDKVAKWTEAMAINEIATILNDVKNEGGDILDIVSQVRIGRGARLNACFETSKGNVNVITFPAAMSSIFMRPHLRTKITLLKGK